MNIFHTDSDPTVAAKNLDDVRVNKMIIESAALMANAIAFHGGAPSDLPISVASGEPYKTKAWQNHPSCLWTKANSANYEWLLEHTKELINQLRNRKGTIHSMIKNMPILSRGVLFLPSGRLTQFANCTPYKQTGDVITAYRMTMAYKWEHDARIPLWTNASAPLWYDQGLIDLAKNEPCEFPWTGQRLSRSKRTEGWLTNKI
jgi:hypothetical protein